MPSTSEKQKKTMRAAAKDPKFAKKVGIPQRVAKEFHAADKRKAERQEKGLLSAMARQMGVKGR